MVSISVVRTKEDREREAVDWACVETRQLEWPSVCFNQHTDTQLIDHGSTFSIII